MTVMTETPTTLYGRSTASIPLEDAIKHCKPVLANAIALLYTPSRCHLAVLSEDGTCYEANDQIVSYRSVFEARIFTPEYELRWLNHSGGLGKAVLLAEDAIAENYLDAKLDDLPALATVPQQYMLWGEGIDNGSRNGWSTLATARIGRLSVPMEGIDTGKGACLKSCEYLAAAEFGNVAVVEERLLSLSAINLPTTKTRP